MTLYSQIHPVDRGATQVWFALCERGSLSDDVDTSHRFLYGHRYWPMVKRALLTTELASDDQAETARRVAEAATRTARVDADLLLGMTAVGLSILTRVGRDAFAASRGPAPLSRAVMLETPSQVLQRRARLAPEGLFGAFRGARRRWTVIVEPDPTDRYQVRHGQPLAVCHGGEHEWCVVGILAGAERLSPVDGDEPFPLVRRACEARVYGRVSVVTRRP